ncbi:MAG: hypothetical protein ACRDCW_16820 [Sarcina sp.]
MKKKIMLLAFVGILGSTTTAMAGYKEGTWGVGNTSITGTMSTWGVGNAHAKASTRDNTRQPNGIKVKVGLWAYNQSNTVDLNSRKYGSEGEFDTSRESYSQVNIRVWEGMHSTDKHSARKYTQVVS